MSRKNIKSAKKKKNEKQQKKQNQQQRQKVLESKSRYRAFLSTAQPQEILRLSPDIIRHFKDDEYRLYAKRLAQIANERIQRIKKIGYESYAVNQVEANGGKFSLKKKKNKIDVQNEINRINKFLGNKTSTIEGIEEIKKKAEETLSEIMGEKVEMTPSQNRTFFKIFDNFKANLTSDILNNYYRGILYDIKEIIKNDISLDEMLAIADKRVKEIYLNYQKDTNYGLSDFEEEFYKEFQDEVEKRYRHSLR